MVPGEGKVVLVCRLKSGDRSQISRFIDFIGSMHLEVLYGEFKSCRTKSITA